jgi:hypothetical protein
MSHIFYLILLPDLTLRNTFGFLQDTGTAYPSRAVVFTPVLFVGRIREIIISDRTGEKQWIGHSNEKQNRWNGYTMYDCLQLSSFEWRKYKSEKPEAAIKYGQSRDTGNFEHTWNRTRSKHRQLRIWPTLIRRTKLGWTQLLVKGMRFQCLVRSRPCFSVSSPVKVLSKKCETCHPYQLFCINVPKKCNDDRYQNQTFLFLWSIMSIRRGGTESN